MYEIVIGKTVSKGGKLLTSSDIVNLPKSVIESLIKSKSIVKQKPKKVGKSKN